MLLSPGAIERRDKNWYTYLCMTISRFLGIFAALFLLALPAQAATEEVEFRDPAAFSAKYVSQAPKDPITIAEGETVAVTIQFKNTGTATWPAKGTKAISAYTMKSRDRASSFSALGWISKKQTPFMKAAVAPGKTGELVIPLTANVKPGKYQEHFLLAAENYSWVKGSDFYLDIVVTPKKVVTSPSAPLPPATTVPPTSAEAPKTVTAKKFMQNFSSVNAKGGERIRFVLGFQNLGTTAWPSYKVTLPKTINLASVQNATPSVFADETWASKELPVDRTKEIKPGGTLREDIYFRAPAKAGVYTVRFEFAPVAPEVAPVPVDVIVTVTEDAPLHDPSWQAYQSQNSTNIAPQSFRLTEEPRIKVGIWKDPGEFVQFLSQEDDYTVFVGMANVGVLLRGQLGVLKYKDGVYSFKSLGIDVESKEYIRLEPMNNVHAVFELVNFERKLTWKGPRNFNKYRGAMEFRRTNDDKALYVINDLLMEDYAMGIGENANGSPMEYLKAQSVAQRTYAYYIAVQSDKHDVRNFDVVSNTGDQLYLGYENEVIMPRFVEAARATRGYMVLYNNQVVITPYFANTDGRTRAWTEVWGGSLRPWLVSVVANYDKERRTRLFGHGVGMSQIDASIRAEKEGLDFVSLLKYYYTGTTVERLYQ